MSVRGLHKVDFLRIEGLEQSNREIIIIIGGRGELLKCASDLCISFFTNI